MNPMIRRSQVIKVDFPGGSPHSDAFSVEGYAWAIFTGPLDENYVSFSVSSEEEGTYLRLNRASTATPSVASFPNTPSPADGAYFPIPDEVMAANWVKFSVMDDAGVLQNTIAQTFTVILKS